eukprot:1192128-Prorocentrum_minimum.AAC.1
MLKRSAQRSRKWTAPRAGRGPFASFQLNNNNNNNNNLVEDSVMSRKKKKKKNNNNTNNKNLARSLSLFKPLTFVVPFQTSHVRCPFSNLACSLSLFKPRTFAVPFQTSHVRCPFSNLARALSLLKPRTFAVPSQTSHVRYPFSNLPTGNVNVARPVEGIHGRNRRALGAQRMRAAYDPDSYPMQLFVERLGILGGEDGQSCCMYCAALLFRGEEKP